MDSVDHVLKSYNCMNLLVASYETTSIRYHITVHSTAIQLTTAVL